MTARETPKLTQVPFVVVDLALVTTAVWIAFQASKPLGLPQVCLVAACMALGAWLGLLGFLTEYRARLKFAEADALASTVDQINQMQKVADQIALATSQWQTVQEHSTKTAQTARQITDQIAVEARAFTESLGRANDAEKGQLRLEVEKLRRGEGEWLQIAVHLMDHVFMLCGAGYRSGQPHLMEQFNRFEQACRDVVRRAGLVPVVPPPKTPYDPKLHQLAEGQTAQPGDQVVEIMACGYTFQGQFVRPVLVKVAPASLPAPDVAESLEHTPGGEASNPGAPVPSL